MTRRRSPARCRGISLVEAVVSVVIVGLMLAAALRVTASVGSQRIVAFERQEARALAESMVAELRLVGFGSESISYLSEPTQQTNRLAYETVDQYHGWSMLPASFRTGSVEDKTGRLQRDVRVSWYDLQTGGVTLSPTNAKLITVTVSRGGRVLAERQLVRTKTGADLFQADWPADPAVVGDGLLLGDPDILLDETGGDLPVLDDTLKGLGL